MPASLLAVAPPHWPGTIERHHSLDSTVPFSLQNAIRGIATTAQSAAHPLNQTNWHERDKLNQTILLHKYYESDVLTFSKKFTEQLPDFLFLGVMTLSLPGAISYAKIAKAVRPDVTIICGGKHISEVLLGRDNGFSRLNSELFKLHGVQLFDIAISGEAEEVLVQIASMLCDRKESIVNTSEHDDSLLSLRAGGAWKMAIYRNGVCVGMKNNTEPLVEQYAWPHELFNHDAKFEIIGDQPTCHLYTYQSRGCVMDCFFCSEKRSVNPSSYNRAAGGANFVSQIKSVSKQGKQGFVEDSIFLSGSRKQIDEVYQQLKAIDYTVSWGCQLTQDLIIDREFDRHLSDLSRVGLNYVFFGMETWDDKIASTLSKNKSKSRSWGERSFRAMRHLNDCGIRVGVSVLFGLGETHATRIAQLKSLESSTIQYGFPHVVSLNWATNHPLGREDLAHGYDQWGTPPDSEKLPFFTRLFGEASENYCMPGTKPPTVDELAEIEYYYATYK